MLSRALIGALLACLALPASADTLWLKNGDRLTGTIKAFDGRKLVLQTGYGGELALDWASIASLESTRPLLVKQDEYSGELAKSLERAPDGYVTLANGNQPKTVELRSIRQLLKPKPLLTDLSWSGSLDVALDYKHADGETEDHNVDLETHARHGRWRHNTTAEYNRELNNDVETEDNYRLGYALDHFIDDQWFWQGRFDYRRDNIEALQRQRSLGSGPGYQFWDNELGSFSLASLVNRSDYSFVGGEQERFYSVALKWDYNRFLFGKRFELYSKGEVGKPLDNVADYSLDAEAGLRYKVTDWAWLNLRGERDLVKGTDSELDETRYLLGFGVGW
jgi:hypothetical protein